MVTNTQTISGAVAEQAVVEKETTSVTPILNIAWKRYAQLNAVSKRRSHAFKKLRIWIAVLGILATLFAIVTEASFPKQIPYATSVIKIFFISIPILASLLAAFGTRAFSNADWLISRAAAEEYLKEIYLYRTILQKKKTRRNYLEKRINEIQRQLYRGLGSELTLDAYEGPIPPYYDPDDPNSDSGYDDLNGDQYFRFRLQHQLRWHSGRINKYKQERGYLTFLVLAAGGIGTFFAAWGGPLSIWVALTAAVTAALIGWQELRNVDAVIKNYSKVILELTSVHDHWLNLEPEERTTAQFYRMVRATEEVLWSQNIEYIRSQQEALKESDLDENAGLVNRTIKESDESEARMKETLQGSILELAEDTPEETKEGVQTSFKEMLGSLVADASSKIVQQELGEMEKSISEAVKTVTEQTLPLTASLQQIAQEFADVEIGRDTTKEQLNVVLERMPKTQDVKG